MQIRPGDGVDRRLSCLQWNGLNFRDPVLIVFLEWKEVRVKDLRIRKISNEGGDNTGGRLTRLISGWEVNRIVVESGTLISASFLQSTVELVASLADPRQSMTFLEGVWW